MENIIKVLPKEISKYICKNTEEIRIRLKKPVIIINHNDEIITDEIITKSNIEDILDKMTESSIYTFYDNIKDGFITLNGGHRVGLCGTAVNDKDKLSQIKDISNINIRVAREIKGVSQNIYNTIVKNNIIENTIIVAPPNMGKTTILRDLTRLISNNIKGAKISLIDERGELSASYMGEAQNDIGIRTDVFMSYKKEDAIIRAVRSMSPTVIITDEIGGDEDLIALEKAHLCGVKIIASKHGYDFSSIPEYFKYAIMLNNKYKDRIGEIVCLK